MEEKDPKFPGWIAVTCWSIAFVLVCVILLTQGHVSSDPQCQQDFNGCVR